MSGGASIGIDELAARIKRVLLTVELTPRQLAYRFDVPEDLMVKALERMPFVETAPPPPWRVAKC